MASTNYSTVYAFNSSIYSSSIVVVSPDLPDLRLTRLHLGAALCG